MILLHRITPFFMAAFVAAGFSILIFVPSYTTLAMILLFLLPALLFARLLTWEIKRLSFWIFLCTPMFFVLSSIFLLLFLEQTSVEIILALVVSLGVWLYAENLFSFYHLPSAYQAYALEYLSLAIYLLSSFFFTSGAFATQLFLQLPAWVPALAVFWAVLFATTGMFWVSKVAQEISTPFAFIGALILSEFYVVLTFLPTSFMSNAAIFTVLLYLFLGLSRAHVLEKLSSVVLRRYLLIGSIFLLIVLATARWF
ncbi:MAG: hypothetical protein ABH826_00400 [Patescibacteria group bacterium]